MTGLPVSNIVNVDIVLSPRAAQARNFGSLLILGDSSVIDVDERMRLYTSIDSVGGDFPSDSPEYQAAQLYFAQSPQPEVCYIGRWARTATRGRLRGGVLSAAQQDMSNFAEIENGGMNISIDGVQHQLIDLDFSGETNLNGVAAVLQAAIGSAANVVWDAHNSRFLITSATTGPSSGVSVATPPLSGTDISSLLRLRTSTGAQSVQGANAESLLDAVRTLGAQSNDWYGLQVAASIDLDDNDVIEAAGYIEASGVSRIFGVTTQDTAALDPNDSTDIASALKARNYRRTFVQYSSSHPFASASIFGRAFTVDFQGSNTTITLKFKQQPSVQPETLTETQAAALAAKNCNVFVRYNNDTAILQDGVMANGFFFDEVHGTDWLQNDLQTAVYNLLFTTPTKIPQTDAGVNQIVAVVADRLGQAVANGLVAPGVWNGPPVGALHTGDTLSTGYYVYAPPVASQSQADREARRAPTIQAAIKLAGAVHSADIIVQVNR